MTGIWVHNHQCHKLDRIRTWNWIDYTRTLQILSESSNKRVKVSSRKVSWLVLKFRSSFTKSRKWVIASNITWSIQAAIRCVMHVFSSYNQSHRDKGVWIRIKVWTIMTHSCVKTKIQFLPSILLKTITTNLRTIFINGNLAIKL